MAELQHAQIRAKLLEQVVPHIDGTDIPVGPGQTDHLLSRAIAAVSVRIIGQIEIPLACDSLVDGAQDNGIDAIYYDTSTGTLILVQSKWSNTHSSSIDSAGVLKFIQGVRDLISNKRLRFNTKVQTRWPEIEDALMRLAHVRLVVAYSGSSNIHRDVEFGLRDFVSSQNDTSELFSYAVVSQKQLFQYFVHEAAPPQIKLTIRLSHYGLVEAPLQAVYGQVSATDVSEWYREHGNNLFAGNIRNFLGLRSEVNAAIQKTLAENPSNFWYFNNGMTIIVEKMKKQAIGGADRSVGIFECDGVTIVNGAQTVGTIGRSVSQNSDASLHARIIVVDDPNSMIGQQITRASNTQNKIDSRNFVALDANQERIRMELLISGVGYEYREGEPLTEIANGFEFVEGIIALACASNEMSYVALSKGYVGGLYADIGAPPYRSLFNSGTSSKRLWALVSLCRRIDLVVKNNHDKNSPIARGIVVHGNRFLMHCVLKRLEQSYALDGDDLISDDAILEATTFMISRIEEALQAEFPDSYLAPLFKNVTKCTLIKARVGL
ncbi:AIPR family protein [Faunimonas sp. B44]|uniref:AIPR family protein n=1 Tax=Faunimonas sp. B44 TaxID=3461493 RepID=UPI004043B46E